MREFFIIQKHFSWITPYIYEPRNIYIKNKKHHFYFYCGKTEMNIKVPFKIRLFNIYEM